VKLGQWIGLFALAVSLYILWHIRELLLLVFTAVVIATVINRLVRQIQRWRIERAWAVIASLGIIIVFLIVCFFVIVRPLAGEFQQLTVLLPQGIERLNTWIQDLKTQVPGQFLAYLPDINTLIAQLQPLANELLGRSFTFVSSSLVVVLHILLVTILTLMLLFDPVAYRKAFISLFPSFYRRRADGILDRCEVALGGWTLGILFNMITIGIFSCIGLWALGVKLAFAQGVLAGLMMFIPNIGPTISIIPPMAIALLDASYGPIKSLGVLALYVGSHVLESHLLTPLVMAKQVSLLPAGVLLSQLFFATVFGFLGLFMAIPLAVVSQVWLQEVLIKDVLDKLRPQSSVEFELASSVNESTEVTQESLPLESSTTTPDSEVNQEPLQ